MPRIVLTIIALCLLAVASLAGGVWIVAGPGWALITLAPAFAGAAWVLKRGMI